MKSIFFKTLIILSAIAFTFTSCKDDCENVTCNGNGTCVDGTCECIEGWSGSACETQDVLGEVTVNGDALNISGTTDFEANQIYKIEGRLVVEAGGTLNIAAGSILKFAEGQLDAASALVVSRGGTLNANGTAENPIIMTSVLDDIGLGEKTGTSLGKNDNQKWGGLIILGYAKISASDGDTEANIEGLPTSDEFKYGGDDDSDSSGSIAYVSVRHGGINIGEGNEINGITLGGVGNGTTIHHVEVVANFDDGIEFFGGSVSIDHALVAYQGDDGIDLDQNWSGTLDNFVVIHGNGATDEALEIDGPESSTYTDGLFTLKNGTIINDGTDGSAADLKSKAQGTIENCTFRGYTAGNWLKLRESYDPENACSPEDDAYDNFINGSLQVLNSEFIGSTLLAEAINAYADRDDVLTDPNDESVILVDCPAMVNDGSILLNQTAIDTLLGDDGNTAPDFSTVGADVSEFSGWTWAAENDEI